MSDPTRHPVSLDVPRHLLDHRITDRAVLPAAHALCLVADTLRRQTGQPLCQSREVVFQGFLFLPDTPGTIPAFVDILEEEDGPMLRHGLQELHGEEIEIPRRREWRPDPDRLEERYALFRRAG